QTAMPLVGYVRSGVRTASVHLEAAFRQGLHSTGFDEGRNVAIDYRYAENQYDHLPSLIAELVRRQVALIYAGDIPTAVAAKAASPTMPIVFRIGGDPVELGLVASLSQPGDGVTGVKMLQAAVAAAWQVDCYKVMLMTGSKKPSTLAFYASAGFEQNKTGFQVRRIPPRVE